MGSEAKLTTLGEALVDRYGRPNKRTMPDGSRMPLPTAWEYRFGASASTPVHLTADGEVRDAETGEMIARIEREKTCQD